MAEAPSRGWRQRIWIILGLITIAFHIGLIFSGLVPNLISRPLHMALALPWALLAGWSGASLLARSWSVLLCLIGVVLCVWIAVQSDALSDQYGFLEGDAQIVGAFALLLIVLEMARRAIGWPLPLVAFLALCYGLFGHAIPGEFGHTGAPLASFLGTLTIAEGGLWGSLTGVSVSVVAVFVIFGAILNAGEAGQGFMNIAAAAAGRLRGGAAKVSVLSSALFGSISGSASANVASTGAVTLPAMTGLGYPKRLAGAVEAVASSGGQIMPPLMGAGAFVMVELTGVPYEGIMAAALIPALLYFFAVWIGIDAYSLRYSLPSLSEDEQPSARQTVVTALFFLGPFALLLWGMFGLGVTPQFAACMAALLGAVLLLFDATPRFSAAQGLERAAQAALGAGRQVATIASIILCASIVIGVLSITGLGVKITSLILSGSGGELWAAAALTALACLILGMEVPTTAAYVICVSVAGPALIDLGLAPLQTHLFIFWFALLSTITPPVCGAVFIAAGMVGENWLKVAGSAMALGLGLYVIPLAMIAMPELLQSADNPLDALLAGLRTAAVLAALSFGVIAPWRWPLRAALIAAAAGGLFL